jgi:uncharacterized protein YidB (DUF937 family)
LNERRYVKEIIMGLLDQVIGGLKSKLTGSGDQSNLLESVIGIINNPETGGLAGLVQNFKDKGLGNAITSWVGTGENLPVSGEQIQQIISSEKIQQIAGKLGISEGEVSNTLAGLLPQVIDKLTPNGTLPEGNLVEQGLSLLKNKLLG